MQFSRRAENLYQKPTCHNSLAIGFPAGFSSGQHRPIAVFFIWDRTSHLSSLVLDTTAWEGNRKLEKTPGHRAQRRETAREGSLSFRVRGRVMGLTLKHQRPVLLGFKVRHTLTATPCQILVPQKSFPGFWEGVQHHHWLVYRNVLSLVARMATVLFPII